MAEAIAVLSFLTTIIQLTEYGWKVVRRISEFQNEVKELPQCFLHISVQLPLLMETVERLHKQAHDNKLAPKTQAALIPVIEGLRKEIEKLDAVLIKVLPSAKASTWERGVKAVKSVASQRTVDDFAAVVRDYVSTLTAYQTAQQSHDLRDLTEFLKDQTLQPSAQQVSVRRKPIWMVGYDNDDEHFVGRDGTMREIEQHFRVKRRVALAGIGGVGYRLRKENPGLDVFWVHGGTKARFESDYRKIAKLLDLRGWDDPNINTVRLVRDYLTEQTDYPWFMVLDSADDRDLWLGASFRQPDHDRVAVPLVTYLPRCQHGNILITTRDSQLGHRLLDGKHDPILVKRLEPSEARMLLLNKLPRDISQENADELTRALEYLPLTITQAAAYLKQIETTASEYIELLRAGKQDIPDLLEESIYDPSRDHESNCVFQTWKISFDQLSKQDQFAADILSLMATLDRQAISKEMLLLPGATELEFRSAIAKLKAYSLIEEEQSRSKYSLHRLVQISTRRWLEHMGQLAYWRVAAVSAVSRYYPADGIYQNWPLIQELNSHVQVTLSYPVSSNSSLIERAKILHTLGHYSIDQGQEIAALGHLSEAVKLRGEIIGSEHEDTLQSMGLLGVAYSRLKRAEDAQQLQLQVAETANQALGPGHRLTLKSMSRLAITYQQLGYVEKCKTYQMNVLDSMTRELGQENHDTMTEMGNLAYTLNKLHQWEAAETLQQELLDLRTRVLGPTHPDTLTAMVGLAWSLKEQGDLQHAEDLEVHAVEMRKLSLGLEHPKTVQAMANLSKTYRLQGRWQEARQLQSTVDEMRRSRAAPRSEFQHGTSTGNTAEQEEDSTSNQLLGIPSTPCRPRALSAGDEQSSRRFNSRRVPHHSRISSEDGSSRHHGQRFDPTTWRSRSGSRSSTPSAPWSPDRRRYQRSPGDRWRPSDLPRQESRRRSHGSQAAGDRWTPQYDSRRGDTWRPPPPPQHDSRGRGDRWTLPPPPYDLQENRTWQTTLPLRKRADSPPLYHSQP